MAKGMGITVIGQCYIKVLRMNYNDSSPLLNFHNFPLKLLLLTLDLELTLRNMH